MKQTCKISVLGAVGIDPYKIMHLNDIVTFKYCFKARYLILRDTKVLDLQHLYLSYYSKCT